MLGNRHETPDLPRDNNFHVFTPNYYNTMSSVTERIQDAAPRNRELLAILSETDHASPALEQQNAYISDLNKSLGDIKKKISVLDAKRLKELKEHEQYRDSVMKRFAYKVSRKTEKFDEKAKKEEREYFEVLQEEHKAKEQENSLQNMLHEAENVRGELDVQAKRHVEAQKNLDELYNSIFQGPTPEFPDEDAKENATQTALREYHDARVKSEAQGQAVKILDDAAYKFRLSIGAVEEALSHSRMDMFGGGTFSTLR